MADLRAGDVPWFMWKTGTSSRRRDAWAAGHNQRFAIGVWVGRFAGAGSPEFVGGKLAEPLLARMFDHPALRTMDAPLPAAPWITTPVARTAASQARLEILHPADGAILFASDATCAVQPRATKDVSFWFLDGVLTPMGESQYLQLPPGHHELRCMDAAGKSAAVTFTVNASLAKN
jgi:membrane carboxypeptidase/penicillin-binding protein PbpC